MFNNMMRDRVILIKKGGIVFKENIAANVGLNQITIMQSNLPIEVGDVLQRVLPSKLVEDYIVTDPGYRHGLHSIPPHFQAKVRRADAPSPSPMITANFTGANSRFNVNSTDNSVNIASDIPVDRLADFITQIRASLTALPVEQKTSIEAALTVLETEISSPAPSQGKIKAALDSMKTIAEGAAGNLVASGILALIAKMHHAG